MLYVVASKTLFAHILPALFPADACSQPLQTSKMECFCVSS